MVSWAVEHLPPPPPNAVNQRITESLASLQHHHRCAVSIEDLTGVTHALQTHFTEHRLTYIDFMGNLGWQKHAFSTH